MGVDVFISSENITTSPAADLVGALAKRGLSISHSPPWGEEAGWHGQWNTDWDAWYGPNLLRSMDESRLIVIVISSVWEVSTWMFAEFEAAIRADVKASYQKILVWDPGEFGFSFPQHDKLIELLPKLAGDAGEVISSRLEAIRR